MADDRSVGGRVKKLAKSVRFWLSVTTAVFGTYAAAAAVGLEVPRWAWHSELQEVAGNTKKNTIEILEQSLRGWKKERRVIGREKDALLGRGQVPDPRLLKDEEEAHDEIEKIQGKLRKIRGY